jgi:hypothetical protein
MKYFVSLLIAAAIVTMFTITAFAQEEPEKPAEPPVPDTKPEKPAEKPENEPEEAKETPAKKPESEPEEAKETPAEKPASKPEEIKEAQEKPEEPPTEGKKPQPVIRLFSGSEYICGKGFFWKTEDEEYSLRIGGRFQFHWILDNYDIHRATRLEHNAEFGIPRAYLFFNGCAKEVKYSLSYRIDNGIFDDWTVSWTPKQVSESLDITAGHFKPRFSREFLTSSGGLSLVNRSLVDGEFRLNRDYGVNFTGRLFENKLRVDCGFFNGLADSSTDNTGFRNTGRLELNLNSPPSTQGDLKKSKKPCISLGFAFSMENDVYDFDGNTEYDDNGIRWTFDWALYWQGFNLLGAYFAQTEQNQKTTGPGDPNEKNRNAIGYSLQGSYFVIPGELELVCLMSYTEPDVKDTRARRGASAGWKHEMRFGVSYYLQGHALKIQADCGTIRERQTHGSLDDTQFRVQFTVCF